MGCRCKRGTALTLAILLLFALMPVGGRAAMRGVYLGAVNDRLVLDLTIDAMPFTSGGVLYVPDNFFAGSDTGVSFVYNHSMKLAMLYTGKTDLRFDLRNNKTYDKDGNTYRARAIRKKGHVFVPLELVCSYFDLTWSKLDTDTVPLIRIKSPATILDDKTFVDAASEQMLGIYRGYEQQAEAQGLDIERIPAGKGQKLYFLVEVTDRNSTMAMVEALGDARMTFLLPVGLMDDDDLIRCIVAGGHGLALLSQATTAEEAEAELVEAREKVWTAACVPLLRVWYEGGAAGETVYEALGCIPMSVRLDWSEWGIPSLDLAKKLLRTTGKYRGDLPVFLGRDVDCTGGLSHVLTTLTEDGVRLCPWRP